MHAVALIVAMTCQAQAIKCPHCGAEFTPTPPLAAVDAIPRAAIRPAAPPPASAAVTHLTKTVPAGTPISWVYLVDKRRFALGHQRPNGYWEYRADTMKKTLPRAAPRMIPTGYGDDEAGRAASDAAEAGDLFVPDEVLSVVEPRLEMRARAISPRR